jgi:hypothetical protein
MVDKEGLLRRALGEDKKSNMKPKQNCKYLKVYDL